MPDKHEVDGSIPFEPTNREAKTRISKLAHWKIYRWKIVTQYKQEVQGNEIKFLWIIHMYMNKNFIEIDTAIRSLDEVTKVN